MTAPLKLRASAQAAQDGDLARAEILAMRALLNEAVRMDQMIDVATLEVHITSVRGVVAGERRVLVVATATMV